MNDHKMEIIEQLMEELQGLMQPDGEDFGSRLGREPKVEMKIETEEPMDGDSHAMDGDLSPEDELKERLMKMRG